MNVHDPAGTLKVTPRKASTISSPLWNVLQTSTASIITAKDSARSSSKGA